MLQRELARVVGVVLGLGCALACSSEPTATAQGGGAGSASLAGASGAAAGLGGTPGSAGTLGAVGSSSGAGAGGVSGGAGAGGVGGGGLAGAGGSVGDNAFTGTAQLMVLGSSNELPTCWRALLWQKLGDAGIQSFDFVGGVTEGPDDCGVAGYDKDLQAQSGIIITNLTNEQFAGWFTAHPPDALLVHFGGADLLQNMPIPGIMAAYTRTLEQARLVTPKVRFLIGQHTPMTSGTCNDCENTVPALNAEIAIWASEHTLPDSPVVVVDLLTGVDPAVDTDDGIHLNMSGSTKVADRFFAAVRPFFAP